MAVAIGLVGSAGRKRRLTVGGFPGFFRRVWFLRRPRGCVLLCPLRRAQFGRAERLGEYVVSVLVEVDDPLGSDPAVGSCGYHSPSSSKKAWQGVPLRSVSWKGARGGGGGGAASAATLSTRQLSQRCRVASGRLRWKACLSVFLAGQATDRGVTSVITGSGYGRAVAVGGSAPLCSHSESGAAWFTAVVPRPAAAQSWALVSGTSLPLFSAWVSTRATLGRSDARLSA